MSKILSLFIGIVLPLSAIGNDFHWVCESSSPSKNIQKITLHVQNKTAVITQTIQILANAKPIIMTEQYQFISNGTEKNGDTNIQYYLSEDHSSILGIDVATHQASFGGPTMMNMMSKKPTLIIDGKKYPVKNQDYVNGGEITGLYCK